MLGWSLNCTSAQTGQDYHGQFGPNAVPVLAVEPLASIWKRFPLIDARLSNSVFNSFPYTLSEYKKSLSQVRGIEINCPQALVRWVS